MDQVEAKIGHFMVGAGCVMEYGPTGEILCLRRDRANFQKGEWELMYGRIDQHEELLEALRREVEEETGLVGFEIKKLLRIWHFYRGEKTADAEIYGFTFHCVSKTKEVKLSTEHSEYAWVKPVEALELIKIEGIQEDIRFFMEHGDTGKLALSGVSNTIEHVL